MNKNKLKSATLFVVLAGLLAVGCGSDDGVDYDVLAVELNGLDKLGDGYVYEGWLIVDGSAISAGRFNHTSYEIEVERDILEQASTYVLTIEAAQGDDPAPSATHVLAGDFSGNRASLSASHGAALGHDFLDVSGSYILETPSSATRADDFDQGIWYLDPSGPSASLVLHELPIGWVYEGWIVTANGPVSTGRFQAADMADNDGAGATAGMSGAPPFPGQDFINPAVVLIGTTAVISIEPDPDDSAAPFAFKPLVDEVDSVEAAVLQSMSNNAASFATGSVVIR